MTETGELKACPFCGGEPKVLRDNYTTVDPEDYPEGGRSWVVCPHCDTHHKFRLRAEAIAAWNRRPDVLADEGLREAVERWVKARKVVLTYEDRSGTDFKAAWNELSEAEWALAALTKADEILRLLPQLKAEETEGGEKP